MDGRPIIAVIPARHHATRFPGKPLAQINGVPMVVRVARRAQAAKMIDEVWVATDDQRIADVVEADGFDSVMTERGLASGTDRVAFALQRRTGPSPSLVVNVQGDEPLIDPHDLDRLVASALSCPDAIATLGRSPSPADDLSDPHCVKVAVAADGRALYFSRLPILFGAPAIIHVGVYAYPPSVLRRFVDAAPTFLETTERLEQLRALELGIPIYVTMGQASGPSIGVDVPADVGRVEAALRASACDRGTT